MKKINITLLLGSLSISSLAMAQEIIPIDSNEDYSEQVESNNEYRQEINSEELGSQPIEANREKTINDLILTSGANLSQQAIEEISSLQEERSLLEARISAAESRQKFFEIERAIKEMNGGSDFNLPSMISSYGRNGNVKAVIKYNDNLYEVSRGTFIDENWVVKAINKDSAELLNIESEKTMKIGINSPIIIK